MKRALSSSPKDPTRAASAVRPTRIFHILAGVSARRFRGLTLLTSLSLVVVFSLLAALSVLSWRIPLVAVAVMVADVAWLRHVAASKVAARRASARAGYRAAVANEAASATAGAAAVARSSARPGRESVVVAPVSVSSEVGESAAGAVDRSAQVFDVAAPNAAVAQPAAETDPSGWAPVPVPPPTYTLKARAERPTTIPAFVELTEYAPVQPLTPDGPDYGEIDLLLEDRRAAGA